jgi:hypothetical protein|eukprot:COSAG01_NODE_842_length_13174_cov_44.463250_3_plen_131_part_00
MWNRKEISVSSYCDQIGQSIHAACAGKDGSLHTWGDGASGNLGTGSRRSQSVPVRVRVGGAGDGADGGDGGWRVVGVGCTRGQPHPKRLRTAQKKQLASGQEGPRCHVVTDDGGLWIAGAAHKVSPRYIS